MNLSTPGGTKILGAIALVVIAAGGWFLLVGPETTAVSETRTAVTDARDRNVLLSQQLATLKQEEAALAQTRAQAAQLSATFPPTADQPGLFTQVTAAADAAGYGPKDVTTLTPTAPTVGAVDPASGVELAPTDGSEVLARQTVSLTAEGSFAETRELLANLETMPRAYLITSVTLGVGADPGSFTTTVTGDMFVMAPVEQAATPRGAQE